MEKLPLLKRIQPYLDDLRNRKVTGRSVACALGVSETHLSRTLKRLELDRIPAEDRKAAKALKTARQEFRSHVAQTLDIKAAASAAHCHPRTIKRTLERLKWKTSA